jgi:hypothetical protein
MRSGDKRDVGSGTRPVQTQYFFLFTAGVTTTASINNTSDTGGKFTAGVVDTLVANLIPAANLPNSSK